VWKESPTLYIPTFFHECSLFIGLVLVTGFIALHIVRLVRQLKSPSYSVHKA
jgi:TRAP-type C4-dicarboxylate transport system permease small subunit